MDKTVLYLKSMLLKILPNFYIDFIGNIRIDETFSFQKNYS